MTEIVILPHHEICPEGAAIEADVGESICEALLRNDIDIEHACEMSVPAPPPRRFERASIR